MWMDGGWKKKCSLLLLYWWQSVFIFTSDLGYLSPLPVREGGKAPVLQYFSDGILPTLYL